MTATLYVVLLFVRGGRRNNLTVITLSSSLCFSRFRFTENISCSTHRSGFSLLDFLLAFQHKALRRSGCLLHFSICEQEWKEFKSSSKAAQVLSASQEQLSSPGWQLSSRQSPVGFSPQHWGVLPGPTPGCRVPGVQGCCAVALLVSQGTSAALSRSQCLSAALEPSRACAALALGSLPCGWGSQQHFPDCPLALAAPQHVFCAFLHKISTMAMHSTLLE